MKAFKVMLFPFLFALLLCSPSLGSAQYFGQAYLPQGTDQLGGALTWHSYLKMGSAHIFNSAGNMVNVYSLQGPTTGGLKNLYLMETTADGGFINGRRIWKNVDLQPSAICEVPGQGYAITAFSIVGGTIDGHLIATDYGGNVLWGKTFVGGTSWEHARSLFTWNPGPFGVDEIVVLSRKGANRTIISRYETSGPLISRQEIQIPGFLTSGMYITPTSDGGYAFVANSYYQIHFFKYDSGGNFQFSTTHTAACYNGFSDINTVHMIQTSDEGYLLTGNYRPYTSACGYQNPTDFWGYVAKFNDAGEMTWNLGIQIPGAPVTHFEAGAEMPNETYMVVGVSDNIPFYVSVDPTGGPVFASTNHSVYSVQETGVLTGVLENWAFSGYTAKGHSTAPTFPSLNFLTNVGLDPVGQTDCEDQLPIDYIKPQWNFSVHTPSATNINLQYTDFFNDTYYKTPQEHCGFMKQGPQAENNLEEAQLNVFPVPASELLVIEVENDVATRLSLVGMDGRQLIEQTFETPVFKRQLDVSALPAGVYFLQVEGEQQSWTRKVVIQ